MLKSISLTFTQNAHLIELESGGVTVFVGPNNSGKSLVLKEIETHLSSAAPPASCKIVKDISILWPELSDLELELADLRKITPASKLADRLVLRSFDWGSGNSREWEIDTKALLTAARQPNDHNKYFFASFYLKYFTICLDGRTRFVLTDDRPAGDLAEIPTNFLAKLFVDDKIRNSLRDVVRDAFGLFLTVEPLKVGTLRIRLSETAPPSEEQSLGHAAREYFKTATYIKDASDGVQAFVGILAAVKSDRYRCILIDEPEAFLHPPLARKLGRELTTTVMDRGGNLLASTHSPDFLLGCVQASPRVRVVRLEYSKGKSKARVVDSAELIGFLRKPLVRSANVISGLFHDGVVVTESDNDRVFYSEIYSRLIEDGEDLPAVLFVNAQNKQTIVEIMGPLRRFGVPAAAIVDIDVIKDGGGVWTGWLTAAQVPPSLNKTLSTSRGDLVRSFTEAGIDMKSEGVNGLQDDNRPLGEKLFRDLAQYGIFAVTRGEVERWLPKLKVPGKKTAWATAMLDRLGSDPQDKAFVKPAADDVWEFMRDVATWIRNPSRSGVQ